MTLHRAYIATCDECGEQDAIDLEHAPSRTKQGARAEFEQMGWRFSNRGHRQDYALCEKHRDE